MLNILHSTHTRALYNYCLLMEFGYLYWNYLIRLIFALQYINHNFAIDNAKYNKTCTTWLIKDTPE